MTTITVTAAHIARGEPQNCTLCPVALAIAEVYPYADYIAVGPDELTIADRDSNPSDLELPPAVIGFIHAFDHREPVRPFSFDLDYPGGAA